MKTEKKSVGISHKHLYSRISYLYQAATYLMNARLDRGLQTTSEPAHCEPRPHTVPPNEETRDIRMDEAENLSSLEHNSPESGLKEALGPSCHLISHLRSVSLKGQIRLSLTLKHSICKRCDAILIPGNTSSVQVENKSRGGKKPWADVLVVTCRLCHAVKRFPVGAKKQCRRSQRAIETSLLKIPTEDIDAQGT
jgi:ribonuclease P protein subunit RPR2